MQVSVETTKGLERRLTVAVEEVRISEAVQSRLQDMTNTVKLKGFRAGKVPLKVVQQHYGKQVRDEVVGDVVQSTFYEAVSQEKLRPAGNPSIDTKSGTLGEGLEYTATFEVYPEFELVSLTEEQIEKATCEISDADIDKMIENIRKQHVSWEKVERAAQENDRINIDFKGMIDGEVFEGGEGQGMDVEIGAGRMIAGFEDGLKDAKAGDDLTLNLVFPEEYHAKDLAGKPVQFAVHVNKVEAANLPAIDADFAKKLGVEDGDIQKMHEEIRNNMQRELDAKIKSRLKDAVMEKLLAVYNFQVPGALVENESQALAQQMMQNLANQGMSRTDLKLMPEMFTDQAVRRVKLGLIMSEIVKQQDLKIDADKVRKTIEDIAAPYEHPQEVIKWYYGDKRRLAEVESLVFEEQVVEWVTSQAHLEEKTVEFEELMRSQTSPD